MDLTAQQIEQIVATAVEKAFQCNGPACACGLSPEAQHELGHFMGVVKHLGGDTEDGYAKGAEVFRQNSLFIIQWRKACERTGSLILRTVVLGILGALGVLTALGVRSWIDRGGNP